MPRKCSVGECRSKYLINPMKVTVYSFPTDKEEWERWVNALPNKIEKATKYMGVCADHWPKGFDTNDLAIHHHCSVYLSRLTRKRWYRQFVMLRDIRLISSHVIHG